ncbi:MAG: ATP-dependent RecD-like DNA helicase [Lachnospiraceae bacterium]|jgi:exodeoxyribonuclease V alpha subunit|nr:ATP-dependent RecD-like DNA helicase [Lachnospiraceae bacterium]
MESLSGFVTHIVFQNKENGYTVLTLESQGEEITCVGTLHGIGMGESISATGEYIDHPVYGAQFQIQSYHNEAPKTAQDMERYLGSGAIKGVGIVLAGRILKRFGDDTFRIMEEEPERLQEVRGISERLAREISAQMADKKELRSAFVFLAQFGISNTLAVKIYNTYKEDIYRIIRENPYRLAEDIKGVGFRSADEIAAHAQIRVDSDYRIRAGILYTLSQAIAEGHCYLPRQQLLSRANQLLEVPEELISLQINNLAMERKVILKSDLTTEDAFVFLPSYFYAELNCAKMMIDLYASFLSPRSKEWEQAVEQKIANLITRSQSGAQNAQSTDQPRLEPDELQFQTVVQCVKNGIFILSGGPGTGKTTTINLMIRFFIAEGKRIALAAPTGRAAKRMTEATGYEAKTIHRLLEINSSLSDEDSGRTFFERNEENPLEADVVIIDEMSMVDILIFQALLKAIAPGTQLILVGDGNQLPSVGAGQVLHDVMASNAFPMVILQKIFRQAGQSDIVQNAHRIHRGEQIALDNKSKDFFLLERKDVNVIYKHMVMLLTEKLPGYVNATSFEIQVLTPMRKGPLGVETLNHILQSCLNPPDESKREYASGQVVFREGDKIMQIKNNYQLEWEIPGNLGYAIDSGVGVFNGDMGRIIEINDNLMLVEFDDRKVVEYPFTLLSELDLAYAITIHKAQGSEYPAIIIPLLSGPKMLLTRNLLYTGVTRAKKCVMILGSSHAIREMICNESESRRYTAFAQRITEMISIRESQREEGL